MKEMPESSGAPIPDREGVIKIWTRLGACLLTGAAVSVASAASPGGLKISKADDQKEPAYLVIAEGGEGGEGGEGKAGSLATGNVAYLSQLELIRGHLLVGVALYQEGHQDAAKTHMKHPSAELYASLVPVLEQRSAPDFSKELEALASAVEQGADEDEVNAAYQDVLRAIDAAAEKASSVSLADGLQVILQLVRTAAEEYAIGVKDGKLVEPHEYQDAYGFVQAARQMLDGLDPTGQDKAAEAIAETERQLISLDAAWPELMPSGDIATEPSLLYGAAARIEIAALSVK